MEDPGPLPSVEADALTTRWSALLDALAQLGGDLELHAVLQRLVDAARELAGARYAAIGVLSPDGSLEDFITSGITADQRAAIGVLPRGLGTLGELVRHPQPLRLRDLREHPSSVGFPPGHPPMRSFLGVPVRTSDAVFGNLYLTDKVEDGSDGDEGFTEADEQMLLALAAAAGVAVENARLYEQALARQRWVSASAGASRALVPAGRAAGSAQVARLARVAAVARGGALVLGPAGSPTAPLLVEGVDGELALAPGDELSAGEVGGVLDDDAPALALAGPGLAERLGARGEGRVVLARVGPRQGPRERTAERAPAASPVEGAQVPDDAVLGLLVLTFDSARAAAAVLDQADEVVDFAERVGLTLEAARAQAFRARLAVFEDRDRIARDLHDLVIQRLFAVGLSLQAAGPQSLPRWLERRLETAVDQLDETISDVRRTIFSLHARAGRGDVLTDVEHELAVAADQLGFTPALHVEGVLDDLPLSLRADVLAVLRETLSNVARHAGASAVDVVVAVGEDVSVSVRDDGRGTGGPGRRSGLANLEERATARGGSLEVADALGGGSVVRWSVPVR